MEDKKRTGIIFVVAAIVTITGFTLKDLLISGNNGKGKSDTPIAVESPKESPPKEKDIPKASPEKSTKPRENTTVTETGSNSHSQVKTTESTQTPKQTYLTNLKISTQHGIVEKTQLETDIYDNVYRNCYKLGYHPWRGDTYIEFVLNKNYRPKGLSVGVDYFMQFC